MSLQSQDVPLGGLNAQSTRPKPSRDTTGYFGNEDETEPCESFEAGKWWSRIPPEVKRQIDEVLIGVMQRGEPRARRIIDAFTQSFVQSVIAMGYEDQAIATLTNQLQSFEAEGHLGVTMSGSLYLDTSVLARLRRSIKAWQTEDADTSNWWTAYFDAIGEAVQAARYIGYHYAYGRLMVPVDTHGDVSVIAMSNESGKFHQVVLPLTQTHLFPGDKQFEKTIEELLQFTFVGKVHNFPHLTVYAGIEPRITRGRQEEIVPLVRTREPQERGQAQRAMQVDTRQYLETGVATQSILKDTTGIAPSDPNVADLTKRLEGVSFYNGPPNVRERLMYEDTETPVKVDPSRIQALAEVGRDTFYQGVQQSVASTPFDAYIYDEEYVKYRPDPEANPSVPEEDSFGGSKSRLQPSQESRYSLTKAVTNPGESPSVTGTDAVPSAEGQVHLASMKVDEWVPTQPDEDGSVEISLLRFGSDWKTTMFAVLQVSLDQLRKIHEYLRMTPSQQRDVAMAIVSRLVRHLLWPDPQAIGAVRDWLVTRAFERLNIQEEYMLEQQQERDEALPLLPVLDGRVPPLSTTFRSLPTGGVHPDGIPPIGTQELELSGPAAFSLGKESPVAFHGREPPAKLMYNSKNGNGPGPSRSRTNNTETQREHTAIREKENPSTSVARDSRQSQQRADTEFDARTMNSEDNEQDSEALDDRSVTSSTAAQYKAEIQALTDKNRRSTIYFQNVLSDAKQQKDELVQDYGKRLEMAQDMNLKSIQKINALRREMQANPKSNKDGVLMKANQDKLEQLHIQLRQEAQNTQTLKLRAEHEIKQAQLKLRTLQDNASQKLRREKERADKIQRELDAVRASQNAPPSGGQTCTDDATHGNQPTMYPDELQTEYDKSLWDRDTGVPEVNPGPQEDERRRLLRLACEKSRRVDQNGNPYPSTDDNTQHTQQQMPPRTNQWNRGYTGFVSESYVPNSRGNYRGRGATTNNRSEVPIGRHDRTYNVYDGMSRRGRGESVRESHRGSSHVGGNIAYYPGNTTKAIDGLQPYQGYAGDGIDDMSEVGNEVDRVRYDMFGERVRTPAERKYRERFYKKDNARDTRIKQIQKFADSTAQMYWENWKQHFLSEAQALQMKEDERVECIGDRCSEGKAGAVVARVKRTCQQEKIPYTSKMLLDELTAEFFDNSARRKLAMQIRTRMQEVNRKPHAETLYEYATIMYGLCHRLDADDYNAANQNWFVCMDLGVKPRRDYLDLIDKNKHLGPARIISLLRELGEHKHEDLETTPVSSLAAAATIPARTPMTGTSMPVGNFFTKVLTHKLIVSTIVVAVNFRKEHAEYISECAFKHSVLFASHCYSLSKFHGVAPN